MVVAQLVERSLLTPEIRGLNPAIFQIFVYCQLCWKDEKKEKRGREWPVFLKINCCYQDSWLALKPKAIFLRVTQVRSPVREKAFFFWKQEPSNRAKISEQRNDQNISFRNLRHHHHLRRRLRQKNFVSHEWKSWCKIRTYKFIPTFAEFRVVGQTSFHHVEAEVVARLDRRNALTSWAAQQLVQAERAFFLGRHLLRKVFITYFSFLWQNLEIDLLLISKGIWFGVSILFTFYWHIEINATIKREFVVSVTRVACF